MPLDFLSVPKPPENDIIIVNITWLALDPRIIWFAITSYNARTMANHRLHLMILPGKMSLSLVGEVATS